MAVASTLREAWDVVIGENDGIPVPPRPEWTDFPEPDLADVRGLPGVRRALEIAAAGGHSIALVGPPGAGKSMLAKRLASLLPNLTGESAIEATRIYSVAGLLRSPSRLGRPPLRVPHHAASETAMRGGGGRHRYPGEFTLAHRGVLLLDEAPEFSRGVLEALDKVRALKRITLDRGGRCVEMPADFQLVVTANPCPCGGVPACRCSVDEIRRYKNRIPKTDITVHVPVTSAASMVQIQPGEASSVVWKRVRAARDLLGANAAGPPKYIPGIRAHNHEMTLGTTIAALAGEDLKQEHIDEARSLTGEE
jgi:magnesium chelatase family protein